MFLQVSSCSFILGNHAHVRTCKKGGWGHGARCCAFQDTSNHASNDTGAGDGVAQKVTTNFFVYTDFNLSHSARNSVLMIGEGVSHTLTDS